MVFGIMDLDRIYIEIMYFGRITFYNNYILAEWI
jgi:hypothetical protein